MKVFVENYNGIFDGIVDSLSESGELTTNYHEADVFLLWQDVRGTCLQLARIAKNHLGKPVVVMQHGRGATRDYCQPNNFELLADKILVWGQAEAVRLSKYGNRVEVVGCPLFKHLRPKEARQGVNVLYVPVIAEKEEPENILVYAALKRWESEKLIDCVYENFSRMKQGWATQEMDVKIVQKPDGTTEEKVWRKEIVPRIHRNVTYGKGLVNVKLTGVHDNFQYMSPLAITQQNSDNHIATTVELLRNTDVMVCLEEGTMQLLACALDIPVIVADVFKYGNYGGVANYDSIEKISTAACYRTNKIEKIGTLIDAALKNPAELRRQRITVCEKEGGAHLGDADENAIKAIRSVTEAVCA